MQEPEEQSDQPETARGAAKSFIRPYVLDGWTLQEVSKKQPRTDRAEYAASIGGGKMIDHQGQERSVSREQIAVTRVGAAPCWGLFDLAFLMAEIRDEQRGYEQPTLAAIFARERERIAQAEREDAELEQAIYPTRQKRPAVLRAYQGGFCRNCGEALGYIEVDGGRTREFCDNKGRCKQAYYRAKKSEEKRAAILQYNSELRDYWYEQHIEDELLTMLQEILINHGKPAARAATDAALFAQHDQIRRMGLAHQYRPEPPRPPRT